MKNRTDLRSYFLKNNIPTQENFQEFIDSGLNQVEDGIQKIQGGPMAMQAQGAGEDLLFFYKNFIDPDPTWRINQNPADTKDPAISRHGLNISNATGESKLFIKTSDGNVGIGTIDPVQKLQIQVNNNGLNLPLYLRNSNATEGGNAVGIGFLNESTGDWPKAAIVHERTAAFGVGKLHFLINNNATNTSVSLSDSKMTISASGKVGIGTTEPQCILTIGGVTDGALGVDNSATFQAKNASGVYENFLWPRWSDNVMYLNYGKAGFNIRNNASVGTMFMNDSGNVGIGNGAPAALLDVGYISGAKLGTVFGRLEEGNGNGAGTFLGVRGYETQSAKYGNKSFAIEHSFYGSINSSVNFYRGGSVTGGYLTFNTNDNSERVRINSDGKVGIGTNAPQAQLHVNGSAIISFGPYYYLAAGGTGPYPVNPIPVSIMASNRIIAPEFDANSDVRIKKDLAKSNALSDLKTLNQIKVTDFKYKDEVEFGPGLKKGVLAQEVEKVFPEAVSIHSEFIPDIFSPSEAVDVSDEMLTVIMKDDHKMETADFVRLITPSGKKEVNVTKINDKIFSVNNWKEEVSSVFVYGKKVDDFRSVNYNAIFTLGISATQELYRQINLLKEELAAFKEKLTVYC